MFEVLIAILLAFFIITNIETILSWLLVLTGGVATGLCTWGLIVAIRSVDVTGFDRIVGAVLGWCALMFIVAITVVGPIAGCLHLFGCYWIRKRNLGETV